MSLTPEFISKIEELVVEHVRRLSDHGTDPKTHGRTLGLCNNCSAIRQQIEAANLSLQETDQLRQKITNLSALFPPRKPY